LSPFLGFEGVMGTEQATPSGEGHRNPKVIAGELGWLILWGTFLL
jgi:hypothetical protein